MADEEQNKSEQATPYKLSKAREKGTVARGLDLSFLVSIATFTTFMMVTGDSWRSGLSQAARNALISASSLQPDSQALLLATGSVLGYGATRVLSLAAALFACVFVFEMIQTGPVFTTEPLKPDFSRLNPANGLKRIFSLRLLIETGKNISKMAIYTAIALLVLRYAQVNIQPSIIDAHTLAGAMASAGARLLGFFVLGAILFAIVDQLIARRDFGTRMRMTRRDVRRELRDREGDPRLKQRRKQLHRQFVKLSKSMRNIRDADVLIVNPTHYAVALRYNVAAMAAPMVVSQGMNQYALRLKRLAFVYGVTIVQNELLAKALYHKGELEKLVPESYFRPVAEIYIAMKKSTPVQA